MRSIPKYLTIAAVAALALLSSWLAQPASAQIVVSGGVNSAVIVAPGGTYGSSVWATLNGALVYLTCPESYCTAGDVIAIISTEPGGAPGTTYALVQPATALAPAYTSNALTVGSGLYSAGYATTVLPAAYEPSCVLGSIPSVYGCTSTAYAPAMVYPYSTGFYGAGYGASFGGCVTFCGGFGGTFNGHHHNGEEQGADVETVCVPPQTFHEHPEGCR